MSRYFFDIVGEGYRPEYDYCGRDLPAPESALHLAELMALDVAVKRDEEGGRYAVDVRNIDGRRIFLVAVQSLSMAA